jgi:proteasome accessory factor B
VAPLRLHRVDGRWHLISWDLDRAADRVFLLSRISGEVRVAAERFDPALRERGEPAIAALLALREQRRAEVLVRCGSVAEARLAPRALGAMNTPVTERCAGFGPPRRAAVAPRTVCVSPSACSTRISSPRRSSVTGRTPW